MNVDKLKPGTCLMWDAPEPFEGYAKLFYNRDDKRIMYPVIVTARKPKNDFFTCHIQSSKSGNFLRGDIEYLRYPTPEELASFVWPTHPSLTE